MIAEEPQMETIDYTRVLVVEPSKQELEPLAIVHNVRKNDVDSPAAPEVRPELAKQPPWIYQVLEHVRCNNGVEVPVRIRQLHCFEVAAQHLVELLSGDICLAFRN